MMIFIRILSHTALLLSLFGSADLVFCLQQVQEGLPSSPHLTECSPKNKSQGGCSEVLGGWSSGDVRAVGISGSLAYIGSGRSLVIVDISNPVLPLELGRITLPDVVTDIELAGGYAFVTASGSGLRVVNISDSSNPVEVGALDTPGAASNLKLWGTIGFVADASGGLRVVNLTQPSAPTEIGFFPATSQILDVDVDVSRAFAYAVDDYQGLLVLDIGTVETPQLVASIPASWHFEDVVTVNGEYVLVTDVMNVRLIDISTPSAPFVAGGAALPDYPYDQPYGQGMATYGHFCYVATGRVGMVTIELSTLPSLPVVSVQETPGFALKIAAAENLALVADGSGGLRVISIVDPPSPTELTSVIFGDRSYGTATSGSLLYIAAGTAGVVAVDISDPNSPLELGSLLTAPDSLTAVAVRGHLAFAADRWTGFRVVDFSDPTLPIQIGGCTVGGGDIKEIVLAGDYAYLVAYEGYGLAVVDISTPSSPQFVGFGPGSIHPYDLAIAGGFAFLAENGVTVFDLTEQDQPANIGMFSTPGLARGVDVSGNILAIADNWGGLRIVDVSDPTDLVEIGSLEVPGGVFIADDVVLVDEFAYVVNALGSLHQVDISDPANPIEVDVMDLPGEPLSISHEGYLLFVSTGSGGVSIVDIGACHGVVFRDGFESGNTVSWSSVTP